MKIRKVESWRESVPLSRPYAIAGREMTTGVDLFFLRLVAEDGSQGLGCASPAEDITGESPQACAGALEPDRLDLVGRDVRALGANCRGLDGMHATPAARAAADMALHDLFARHLGISVVDLLGRCHHLLPTSITIGIKSVEESLAEGREYVGRGFRCLKVKLGNSLEEDLERLHVLRGDLGADIRIRVDANQGYGLAELRRLEEVLQRLQIEFVEQPLPVDQLEEMRGLPESLREVLAADESLHTERDGVSLLQDPVAAGIWVIKLMKCGGITTAMALGRMARAGGVKLMWGCMDESAISIAAALHAAYACPATRYLDLDGSFDLARDPAAGGFRVEDGNLVLEDGPGLGVQLRE